MKKKVESNEIKNLIILFGIVLGIFLVFFIVTLLVTGKKELVIPTPTYSNEIQFNEILAGEITNQKTKEYYVLVHFEEDSYYALYDAYLAKYEEKSKIKYYNVNLDVFFNNAYVAEKSDISKGVYSQATLLKIKDAKVVASYEGKDAIVKYLAGKIK